MQQLELFGQVNENTNGKETPFLRRFLIYKILILPRQARDKGKTQKKSGVSLGVLGVGSDSSRADSYYHWGALNALVAMAEEGAYPSDML